MKLAVITSHINKSLQWVWTSEGLAEQGIGLIHIIINEVEPVLKKDLEGLGIGVYWLRHRNAWSHLPNLIEVIRILRRHKIDIVHTSLPYGNLIGQLAAVICGIGRRVTTCENASWAHDFRNRKHELIDKLTYRLARRVIATSRPAFDYLKQRWRVDAEKLTIIGHALKVEDFADIGQERMDRLRKKFNLTGREYVIGVVARFEYWKGHRDIVEAIHLIAADNPDIRVLIFGAGGLEFDNVMALIDELGLSDVIQYKGFTDDPIALYRLFDIHVHVPVNEYVETFGINIIEGMMAGCAQILTRSGVSYSTARDRKNCLVVDYRSPGQIARAILELKADPELGKRLGAQARADAMRDFNIQTKIEKHIELYGNLV